MNLEAPFFRTIRIASERIEDSNAYPFSIPSVRDLNELRLAAVTYFIGENGSGKSTILEALALACGFNAEGGSMNFNFATRTSESKLHHAIRLARESRRPRTGFFLRAESFFNLATEIERLDAEPSFGRPVVESYGGRSLHEQSHGESVLALAKHRFGPSGLYILDEPEAALSPAGQLSLLSRIHELLNQGSQFIVATHAPLILSYPNATIYQLDKQGIQAVAYEQAEQVKLTRAFLNDRESFFDLLFRPGP